MTNHEKFSIEMMGRIESGEQLKELQADMRRLPNFGAIGFCCSNVTNRDFWALLKNKRTGELHSYFGSRASFNAWGQEEAVEHVTPCPVCLGRKHVSGEPLSNLERVTDALCGKCGGTGYLQSPSATVYMTG